MRSRTIGTCIALGTAFLALRPIGPLDRVSRAMLVPGRFAASFGMPSVRLRAAQVPEVERGTACVEEEAAWSLRLERAVLRSAWPSEVELRTGVVAVPGEALGRIGDDRDRLTLRLSDTRHVEIGQPVVLGDAYIGSVDRIPYAEYRADRPGLFERVLRTVGLSSAPRRSPQDIVEVELITGKAARIGGLVEHDQDGESCRLVAGALVPLDDRIWLAIHNPESRATNAGQVRVHEPLGLLDGFDSLAEGFLIGELTTQRLGGPDGEADTEAGLVRAAMRDPFATEVRGIVPHVDFGSGLNQVLVLTRPGSASGVRSRQLEPIPVLDDGGWRSASWLTVGDASPWRSTARLSAGRRAGISRGAAVVDGVRLVGRVESVDPLTSAVALVDDPGLQLMLVAQAACDPDATPLALGRVRSEGRGADGELRMRWMPEPSNRHGEWLAQHALPGDDGVMRVVEARLWTGSGMERVPRGLLVGTVTLPLELEVDDGHGVRLSVRDSGAIGPGLRVRTGGARLSRPVGEERLAGR